MFSSVVVRLIIDKVIVPRFENGTVPTRRVVAILGLLVASMVCAELRAAPPWSKLVLFKHLEADPEEMYPITEDNGPWMIMAATFSGDGAEEQAGR